MHLRTLDSYVGPYCITYKGYGYNGNYDGWVAPTFCVLAGGHLRTVVPEFLDQVTHKHESTVVHAKYTSPRTATIGFSGVEPFWDTKGVVLEYEHHGIPKRYEHSSFEYEDGQMLTMDDDGFVTLSYSHVYRHKSSGNVSTHTEQIMFDTKDYYPRDNPGNSIWVAKYTRSGDYSGLDQLHYIDKPWSGKRYQGFSKKATVFIKQFVSPSSYLRFQEIGFTHGSIELPAQLRSLCLEASKQAIGSIPAYADNNIANLAEMFSSVVSLLSEGVEFAWKGVSSLAGLWLAYRYSYSTTKSDTQQAIDAIARRAYYSYYRDTRIDGNASATIDGVSVSCHLKTYCHKRSSDLLSAIRLRLWEYGLLPSKYRLWDLVPFSFVADWVFNIGDTLKEEEDLSVLSHGYTFVDSSYSIKYTVSTDLGPVECYTRWESVPIFYADYNLHLDGHRPVKIVTQTKRAMDTIALAQGFRR